MPEIHDVIVLGLGAMGSAAAYHLARRGSNVLGIDRFAPPHTLGSSHGESRIIREAYFEHPLYVPLVQRAYELWEELESLSGQSLLVQTGGLMIGRPEGVIVRGARTSAETHRLAHEVLPAAEVTRRFPGLRLSAEMVAVWEPRAGVLFPEKCVQAHLELAAKLGAILRFEETVKSWSIVGDTAQITTDRTEYWASKLVICAGSWVRQFVPDLPVATERQSLVWFESERPEFFAPGRCPIYICEYASGKFFYGFPDLGRGVKVALHHEGSAIDPDNPDRSVSENEISRLHATIHPFLPTLGPHSVSSTACIYTNTPDENFLIDYHPRQKQLLVCSPCSGHGFKFSAVVGEIVADRISNQSPRFDLTPFQWRWR